MPKGLKPVRAKLADGTARIYWYHRATGKRLKHDPETAAGLLEIRALDERAKAATTVAGHVAGSYAAIWAKYRESPAWTGLKPRTRSDYQAVRDWLGPAAERPVSALTAGQVAGLRDKAAQAKGRRFGNYVVSVLRLTLAWAKEHEMVRENPADGVKAIRKPIGAKAVNRAWRPAEVAAFRDAAPPQLLVPFALGLFAGMRQGDAIKVTWGAYDGATIRWIAGKNGEDCVAPVTGPFKAVLDTARERRGRVLQIATTSNDTAWTASGFRASFFKLIRELVKDGKLQPGCTFHGLRHTVGTSARDGQESEFRIAAAIGDRTTAMAAIYGRDADREGAQSDVLATHQKRYENADWKTRMENAPKSGAGGSGRKGKKL